MDYRRRHEWPTTKEEAYSLQKELANEINLNGNFDEPKLIAAVDTAYGTDGDILYAAAVVTTFPDIELVERAYHSSPVTFPYVPGLFYFREGQVIVEALAKVTNNVDLIIVHGHGIAHPRYCGMACFVGLTFGKPTIGCARKLLTGTHRPVGENKGSFQPIYIRSREVGYALRSKGGVKPIYISPAYKCDLSHAKEIIVQNLRGYRLPEPLRLAHLLANKYRRYVERKEEAEKSKQK